MFLCDTPVVKSTGILSKPFVLKNGQAQLYYRKETACDSLNSINQAQSANPPVRRPNSICALREGAKIANRGHLEIGRGAKLVMGRGSNLVVETGARLYIGGELMLEDNTAFVVRRGIQHIMDAIVRVDSLVFIDAHNCVRPLRMHPRVGDTWLDADKRFLCSMACHFSNQLGADVFERFILPAMRETVCPEYGVLMKPTMV